MKVRTQVQAGGRSTQHNQTAVRVPVSMKVRTDVKAGGKNCNHNQTVARA